MNSRNRSIIMAWIKIKCPLCQEEFYSKYNVRSHLATNHTDIEGKNYIVSMTILF